MSSEPNSCIKCNSEMIKGYTLDRAGHGYDALKWCEGDMETSWLGGIKVKKAPEHHVIAYKCSQCGFLEFYAHSK